MNVFLCLYSTDVCMYFGVWSVIDAIVVHKGLLLQCSFIKRTL